MNQKELGPVIIAVLAMILTIGAFCTATPAMAFPQFGGAPAGEMWTPKTGDIPSSPLAISGCDELDQHLLRLYDHNHNGLIDEKEIVYASLDYNHDRILQRDFRQIEYAYEHQCVVIGSAVPQETPPEIPLPEATPPETPTPAPIRIPDWTANPFEDLDGYFTSLPSIGDFLNTPNHSTVAICFEYTNGSHTVIRIDDPELTNVSLQIDGVEVAKYPATDILGRIT